MRRAWPGRGSDASVYRRCPALLATLAWASPNESECPKAQALSPRAADRAPILSAKQKTKQTAARVVPVALDSLGKRNTLLHGRKMLERRSTAERGEGERGWGHAATQLGARERRKQTPVLFAVLSQAKLYKRTKARTPSSLEPRSLPRSTRALLPWTPAHIAPNHVASPVCTRWKKAYAQHRPCQCTLPPGRKQYVPSRLPSVLRCRAGVCLLRPRSEDLPAIPKPLGCRRCAGLKKNWRIPNC